LFDPLGDKLYNLDIIAEELRVDRARRCKTIAEVNSWAPRDRQARFDSRLAE